MRFMNKETGEEYLSIVDALNAECDKHTGCASCPFKKSGYGDYIGCMSYAIDHYKETAEVLGLKTVPESLGDVKQWLNERGKEHEEDMVNQPVHYISGGIECADALDAMVSAYPDPNAAALAWQVGKYIWRHPLKWNPLEDLKKARWYLDRLIAHYEKKEADNGA